jgi:hypothetical protein
MIDNQSKMAQGYGYIVCLITVIAGLVSIGSTVNALFDYADPIHSDRYSSGYSVTTFNAYKRDYQQRTPRPRPLVQRNVQGVPVSPDQAMSAVDTVSDATLRQMYQEDRQDRIETTRFRAMKQLVGSLLMLVVSGILFSIHWKWLRRQSVQTA